MLTSATLSLALASCTVGPDYVPPQVQMPATWSEIGAATQPASPDSAWWRSFGDPTLDRLIDRAVAANTDVRIAIERLREARAQRGVVAAALWPQIDTSASYSNSHFSKNGFIQGIPATGGGGGAGGGSPPGAIFPGQEINLQQVGLDASWEIDIFGGQRRAVQASEADIGAAAFGVRDALVSLLGEVADGYVQFRAMQARLDIAQRTAKSQQETVDVVHEQATAGLANDLDVSRAQTQAASSAARVPDLDAAMRIAVRRLEVLLNMMPGALDAELLGRSATAIPAPPDALDAGIPSDVLRRRPDIRAAERRLAASTARIGIAVADLFPRFSLTGSFGLQSQDIGDLPSGDSRFWLVGPSVRWPIMDFGRIRSNIAVQDARAAQASIMYEGTVLRALSDVEIALVQVSRERQRLEQLRRAADAADRSFALAEETYRSGLLEFLDLLDVQRTRDQSWDVVAQSEAALASDTIGLFKALGGGWAEFERATPVAAVVVEN